MNALETRIDALATSLRHGDFTALEGMAESLEHELSLLDGQDAAGLARIRARASEVQVLLDAALRGLRAARFRVGEIRSMGADGSRLVTYDGRGQRAESGLARGMMQRL